MAIGGPHKQIFLISQKHPAHFPRENFPPKLFSKFKVTSMAIFCHFEALLAKNMARAVYLVFLLQIEVMEVAGKKF